MRPRFEFLLSFSVVIACIGCASSGRASSAAHHSSEPDFCSQLKDGVLRGSKDFVGMRGERVSEELYRSAFRLPGAYECFIYEDGGRIYPNHLICSFGDSSVLDEEALRNAFLKVDGLVNVCLAQTNWKGFFYYGEPSPRFFRSKSTASVSTLRISVKSAAEYIDRYEQTSQSVTVLLADGIPRLDVKMAGATVLVVVEAAN